MRTAVLAFLVTGLAYFWLSLSCALSNADFIYMCCGASMLADSRLPVSPYFPAGYPLLLLLLKLTGLSALTAGMALAAFGTGLSAGAVAYCARLFKLPPAVALGLALLAASLPDVFQIALNPHLDALYTGLAAVFIACALRAIVADSGPAVAVTGVIAAALLLTLRFHALLVVVPVALVLFCWPRVGSRRLAVYALITTVLISLWSGWALYVTTGSLDTAVPAQIAIGREYREHGDEAALRIFNDYAAWREAVAKPSIDDILDGVKANWPVFVARQVSFPGYQLWLPRPVYALALLFWLIALIAVRRLPPTSILLLLFIGGYTLAVSPTYFTPRASALPEVIALMLLASALSVLIDWRGKGEKALRLDPSLAGLAVFVLLLIGTGYNAWRERVAVFDLQARAEAMAQANEQALELAGGRVERIYGPMGFTGWPASAPDNLPGATYSRLWLDDPDVAPMIDRYIPKYDEAEVVNGDAPVSVVLLWPGHNNPREQQMISDLEQSWTWREQLAECAGTRIWIRGG